MTETAQGLGPAESEVMSTADALASAADAFKVQLGQAEPARPRHDRGRFASAAGDEPGGEEIEAEAGAVEAAEAAESRDAEASGEEAADEAQPAETELPKSWPAEQAELWESLPPEAQAFIAEREGQRDRAVNAKFQEAANVLKANEAVVTEAQSNRQLYAEAADLVLSLVAPA